MTGEEREQLLFPYREKIAQLERRCGSLLDSRDYWRSQTLDLFSLVVRLCDTPRSADDFKAELYKYMRGTRNEDQS